MKTVEVGPHRSKLILSVGAFQPFIKPGNHAVTKVDLMCVTPICCRIPCILILRVFDLLANPSEPYEQFISVKGCGAVPSAP